MGLTISAKLCNKILSTCPPDCTWGRKISFNKSRPNLSASMGLIPFLTIVSIKTVLSSKRPFIICFCTRIALTTSAASSGRDLILLTTVSMNFSRDTPFGEIL